MNPDSRFDRASWLALAGVAAVLSLMGARLLSVVSLVEPIHMVTSGDEQSSLIAIWRVLEGLSPYQDRFRAPFGLASYNWLYYQAYAGAVASVAKPFGIEDVWLPTIARLFTVAGMAAGAFFAYRSFRHDAAEQSNPSRRIALSLAILVAAGPLIGFWGLTVRPDVWAMALEIAAVLAFLRLRKNRPWTAVAAATAILYAAWSFKQTSVVACGAIGMILLLRGCWAQLFAFTAMMVSAWAATFLLGGEIYRTSILFSDIPLYYAMDNALRNIANFAVKTLPILVPLATTAIGLAACRTGWRSFVADDRLALGLAGSAIGIALAFVTSIQTGAAENYYFTTAYFLALMTIAGFDRWRSRFPDPPPWYAFATAISWSGQIALVAAVFAGLAGTIDLRGQHGSLIDAKACIERLPKPLFVDSQYLSLPWMNPAKEPLVLSYFYARDRAAGRHFEGDGIGGRIARGEFATLMLNAGTPTDRFDGAALDGYVELPGACRYFHVMVRREGVSLR